MDWNSHIKIQSLPTSARTLNKPGSLTRIQFGLTWIRSYSLRFIWYGLASLMKRWNFEKMTPWLFWKWIWGCFSKSLKKGLLFQTILKKGSISPLIKYREISASRNIATVEYRHCDTISAIIGIVGNRHRGISLLEDPGSWRQDQHTVH